MTLAKRQAGLGFLGWLIMILVFGGAISVSLKLIPMYIDYHLMSSDLEAMANAPDMKMKIDGFIRQNLKNRFSIDNIRNFDFEKNIKIDRSTPDRVFVIMQYKIDEPLIGNIDLLVSFHKKVELKH